ncbi:Membrane protein, partial [Globisporangium splendens]
MITEVLASTWFSMCAVMVRPFAYASVLMSCSHSCACVDAVVVCVALQRPSSLDRIGVVRGVYDPARGGGATRGVARQVVCHVHGQQPAAVVQHDRVDAALDVLVTLGDLRTRVRQLGARGLRYFAYDLWDYVLHRLYIKSPGIVVHHVVILICYISALTKTVGVPLLSLALICELHSAFMHLRKLMSMSNYSVSASATYKWVWHLQWATFLLARTVPHAGVTWLVYQARGDFAQPTHFWMAFVGMLFINALNIQLLRGVYGAFRKDFGYSKRSQDAAPKATKTL